MAKISTGLFLNTLKKYATSYAVGAAIYMPFQEIIKTAKVDHFMSKHGLTVDGVYILDKKEGGVAPIPFPLFNVRYFQYAISHETLEYRSIGAEFLAQQRGGHLGIRIDMLIPDPIGTAYAIAIEKMIAISRPRKEYDKGARFTITNGVMGKAKSIVHTAETLVPKPKTFVAPISMNMTAMMDFANISELIDELDYSNTPLGKAGMIKTVDTDDLNPDSLRSIWRRTGTLFMRERVVFDVYIETMRYGRRNLDGINYASITLLFREFRPEDKRVAELRYGRMPKLPRDLMKNLTCSFADKPVVMVIYKNDLHVRNAILENLKKKMKKKMKRRIMAMMGLTGQSDIAIDESNAGIIDIYEFLTEMFNVANAVYTAVKGSDYSVKEFRVGGRVLRL